MDEESKLKIENEIREIMEQEQNESEAGGSESGFKEQNGEASGALAAASSRSRESSVNANSFEGTVRSDDSGLCSRCSEFSAIFRMDFLRIFVSGVGFLSDAYDLFIINLVMLFIDYDSKYNNFASANAASSLDKSSVATAVLAGAVIGQLLFGVLADVIGRRKCFIITLSLIVLGSFCSAFSFSFSSSLSIYSTLSFFRFVLGLGIGGEYPLSSTISSESDVETKARGRVIALVFSTQGLGMLLAPSVMLLLLSFIKNSADKDFDLLWRLGLGFGCLPGVFLFYYRLRMHETSAFQSLRRFQNTFRSRWIEIQKHKKNLLAATMSWLIFDVVFYANGLFSATVLANNAAKPHFNFNSTSTPSETSTSDPAVQTAVFNYLEEISLSTFFLSLIALPGYYAAILVVDRIGRRRLQLIGFLGMALSYSLIALIARALDQSIPQGLFFFLYGVSFFFCNFGPNVTTYIIPAELFPTQIRASCAGLAAAAGKFGAVLGGLLMPQLLSQFNLSAVMAFSALVSLIGFVWTFFLTTETKNILIPHAQNKPTGADYEQDYEFDPTSQEPRFQFDENDIYDVELNEAMQMQTDFSFGGANVKFTKTSNALNGVDMGVGVGVGVGVGAAAASAQSGSGTQNSSADLSDAALNFELDNILEGEVDKSSDNFTQFYQRSQGSSHESGGRKKYLYDPNSQRFNQYQQINASQVQPATTLDAELDAL